MNREQVQLIVSTLQFVLGEPERARAIENATHIFADSPLAGRLLNAALHGDWQRAISLTPNVIPSDLADLAVFQIESCHVVETLLTEGGEAAMQVIKTSTRPEHASQLGLMLFQPPKESVDLRQQLHSNLRQMLGPQHTAPSGRLTRLLRAALQFKHLEESGCAELPVEDAQDAQLVPEGQSVANLADSDSIVKAYVLEAVTSLSVNSPENSLLDLKSLCEVAAYLNLFGISSTNRMVRTVIKHALTKDSAAAIQLMRERNSMSSDIIEYLFGSIIVGSDDCDLPNAYNYLERYEQHRTPDMPKCDSVLHLGQVVEAVLNKYSTRIPTQSLFVPVLVQPYQFPSRIIQKLRLDSEVWVVDFNNDGSYLAIACSNGTVMLYSVDVHTFKLTRKHIIHLSNGAHRIAWHPDGSKLLIEDTEGFSLLYDIPTASRVQIMPRQSTDCPTTTAGNGNVCWHPTDPSLFFRVEWDNTLSLRYTNGRDIKWWFTLGEPLQSVTPTANRQLAVLTAKTDSAPQRILVFDNYDIPSISEEFELPSGDGQYSSLQCSVWDPRTLLLMGPNGAILLLDITGKRETITLSGPVQQECIIAPRFAGPMDKYVLCGSEEKDPPVAWVFNRFTGDVVAHYHDHKDMVNSVSLYAGENVTLLATGGDDMDVIIYSARTNDLDDDTEDDSDNFNDEDNENVLNHLTNGRT